MQINYFCDIKNCLTTLPTLSCTSWTTFIVCSPLGYEVLKQKWL